MTQHILTHAEAIETARVAVDAAQNSLAELKALELVLQRFTAMVEEGRNKGKSPAALIDATIKDLKIMSDMNENDPFTIRNVCDLVYGAEVTDRAKSDVEAIAALAKFLIHGK